MTAVRQHLHRSTADAHHLLEGIPLVKRCLAADVTLPELMRYEAALAAWFTALQPELVRHAPPELLAPQLDWLEADLAVFAGQRPALPGQPAVPACADAVEALGTLYVMNGSLLGNRLIARHLQAALPVYHLENGHYFRDDGTRVVRWWQPLLAEIENFTSKHLPYLTEQANITFKMLGDWLHRCNTDPEKPCLLPPLRVQP